MREQDSKLKMAPRAGMPVVNIANGLDWQTGARGSFNPQRFSGALANHHRRCRTPKDKTVGRRECRSLAETCPESDIRRPSEPGEDDEREH